MTTHKIAKSWTTEAGLPAVDNSRAHLPVRREPLMSMEQLQQFIDYGLEQSKRRIVTFNHPDAFK